jgi:hypothetical protein
MTTGQRRDLAWTCEKLSPVVHQDRQLTADVVLEMRSFATRRVGDGFNVVGPAPSGLKGVTPDFAVADLYDLGSPVGELANLIGLCKRSMLRFVHRNRLSSVV